MKRVVVGLSGGVDSSVAAYLLKEQGYDVVGLFMRNWHDTAGTLSGDCPWYDDQMFAELVAKRIDIPFHYVDLSKQYRERVVDYMFSEYEKGRTPNPDVLCNREIKFDVFLNEALKLGADLVATGHYCRKEETQVDGQTVYRLLAGLDPNKDQSYFLCQLSQEQLRYAVFPIGSMLKPEVRRIAAEQKLATAKRKDSQGICFVGKVDLPVFLQQKLKTKRGDIVEIPADWSGYAAAGTKGCEAANDNFAPGTGSLVAAENASDGSSNVAVAGGNALAGADSSTVMCDNAVICPDGSKDTKCNATADMLCNDNTVPCDLHFLHELATPFSYSPGDGIKVGEHDGAHFYTIGQRKGLNIGGKPEPLFVISIDVEHNVVYVGQGQQHPGLYRRGLHIKPSEMHWVRPDLAARDSRPRRYAVRIRYRQPLQGAVLYDTAEGGHIIFDTPQRGITAGQFAAWYDGEELIGSGVIAR